jgi:glucose-6-phosphate isomerase
VRLSLYHDSPPSTPYYRRFEQDHVLARLKALDSRARRKGLAALDPSRNRLIPIGMEIDARGRVTKNSYGVFHLSWWAQRNPSCAAAVMSELDEIRARIRQAHGTPLRFLIWAGMGGSAEDKSMYNAVGLLGARPRCYVLDSTDPAKLRAILEDITRRSGLTLPAALRATLVVGMAMGMTSYEPVVNLEKIRALYERHRIDSSANFVYMTLAGSLLDRFARGRGYRRVELQPDGGNSTAGRHSGPLTKGSLYPLGLARVDLDDWIRATFLTDDDIAAAWRLAAFLHAQGLAGRDKVTWLMPRPWEGAALWTKQDFEESLGKSERIGIKIVIGERPRLASYHSPKDARQDRVFVAVQAAGMPGPDAAKVSALRRAGYPLAVVSLGGGVRLSAYMQWIHYVVFGLGWLRDMNFVTQPSVELYKAITGRVVEGARKSGGIHKTPEWARMKTSRCLARHGGGVTLCYEHAAARPVEAESAAGVYAKILSGLVGSRRAEYAELTFFGDTRYSPSGRNVRRALDRAAERLFRRRLKIPVDVYEGPAMNHSYHEMIIGHGKAVSTVLVSERQESMPKIGYTADYHLAQFLATQLALAERSRPVMAILLRDLEAATLKSLDAFFGEAAAALRKYK